MQPNSSGVLSAKKGTSYVLGHLELWQHLSVSELSNLTLKCCEKLILASGSPVLATMFRNDFSENQKRIVSIKYINSEIIENIFRYIYVGECDLLEYTDEDGRDAVGDLLVAADKYNVASLKKECEINLSRMLTVSTRSLIPGLCQFA